MALIPQVGIFYIGKALPASQIAFLEFWDYHYLKPHPTFWSSNLLSTGFVMALIPQVGIFYIGKALSASQIAFLEILRFRGGRGHIPAGLLYPSPHPSFGAVTFYRYRTYFPVLH